MVEQVFQQARIWHEKYPELMMNLNVSYIQFEDNDFVDFIIDKAFSYNISPSKIVIELTESCHVSNVGQLSVYFKQLQDAGFQIALDDFGTAYSSLSLLKNLPANYIKIDHSLVKELSLSHNHKDFIIIDNLVHLSHCLSFECIIEGVENKGMENILMNIAAPYFQGYYYSRPVPKQEFEKLLEQRRKIYGTIKS